MKTKQDLILLFTTFVVSSALIFLSPYFIVPVVCVTVMWALERHKQLAVITELEDRIGEIELNQYEVVCKLQMESKQLTQKLTEMEDTISQIRAANSMNFRK